MTFHSPGGISAGGGRRRTRALGQHFLVDENIAEWIVEQAGIEHGDRVLEIGPGRGILTRHLAARTPNLLTVEIDRELAGDIRRELGVEVMVGDAVRVELPDFDRVVSNLPYQISSPITFRLLSMDFRKGILMYQKEFASHLVAPPGTREYSRVSVMASTYAECRILRTVPRGCFRPVPKVDSAVVEVIPRKPEFEMPDRETFASVVRVLFSHKNRKARHGIVAEHRALGLDRDTARILAGKLPHADRRPRELSPAELAGVAKAVFDFIDDF